MARTTKDTEPTGPGGKALRAINDIYATRAGLVGDAAKDDGKGVTTPGEVPDKDHEGDAKAPAGTLVDADGKTKEDRGETEEPAAVDPKAEGLAKVTSTR